MEPIQTKKTVYFEVNGKRYDRIEDVPPEFRDMVRAVNDHPEAWKNATVTKVTSVSTSTGGLPEGFTKKPDGSHREKFLRETVLPNLHLMDAKTQAEILRALSENNEKQSSQRRTIFWTALLAVLGLLMMFGFSVLKGMFAAP